jgi:site-specific recombinase XerD
VADIPFITIFSRHGRIPSGPNKGKMCPHAKRGKKREDQSFLDCQCRKHLSWTDPLTKKQVKIKAGTRSKEEASKVKASLERKFRGEAPEPKEPKTGILVASACASYIEKVSKSRSRATVDNTRVDFKHLQKFCHTPTMKEDGRIVPLPPVLTLAEITDDFYQHFADTWDTIWPSRLSQKIARSRFSAFFSFCVRKGWMTQKPTIEQIQGVNSAPSFPLNQDEVERLFAAIPTVFPAEDRLRRRGNAAVPACQFSPTEEQIRVRNFLSFQLATGLAVSDAVTLSKSSLTFNSAQNCYELKTHRIKTGRAVYGAVELDVVERALTTPNKNPKYLFWDGRITHEGAAHWFARRIARLFKAAKIEDVCFTKSHRLRDTFVVRLLAKGVSIEDVAAAIGDTVAITERSYAKWLPERQARLTRVISATFEKPLPADPTAAELELLARLKAKYETPGSAPPSLS